MSSPTVERLSAPPSAADLAALHALLRDAVEGGASVGYRVPLADSEVAAFWSDVLAEVSAGTRVLLVDQWIQTGGSKWSPLTEATFSHDGTGKVDRLDRFMGVENGQFFLSQGGFLNDYTEYGTPFNRPARKAPPVLDLPDHARK